jgi:putative ABC transport system permease protein
MRLFDRLRSWADAVLHRSRGESEMDAELRFHMEAYAEDLVRSGVRREEALRRARLEFGGVERVKEECRESLGVSFIESFVQDVRFGLRMLRKSPGFTTVAVLTLALGIGANTAIFSLIDAVMLRTLPVDRPEELVQLKRQDSRYVGLASSSPLSFLWSGGVSPLFSYPLWDQVRAQQDVFSGVFAWSNYQFDLARGGTIQPADGSFVSGDFFTTLGLFPAAGRLITASDDHRGCPPVAVLSYRFWQGHYGGASTAVGSVLSLDQHLLAKVIGVAPRGFYGMDVGWHSEVFVPTCTGEILGAGSLDGATLWWLNVAGRIKPGISRSRLIARLRVLSPRVFAAALPQYWSADEQRSFVKEKLVATSVATGTSVTLRQQFDQPLQVLMAIVGLVLLIACANITSLMLTRSIVREKEIAVRLALGASRWRLIKQLLTECFFLSLMGAIVGFLFARWGTAFLVRSIPYSVYAEGNSPVLLNLSLGGRVLGFTAVVAILTVALFGILPTLRSTGVSLTSAMKGIPTTEFDRPARFRSRKWIVASQVAFSMVLLVAAGLLLRSFAKLATLNPGFDPKNVLIVYPSLWSAKIPRDQRPAILDQIENRLRALPGVLSASRSSNTPAEGDYLQKTIHTEWSKTFTDAQSLQLVEGRNFNRGDTSTSPMVAVIDQTAARRFFPGLDPVGKTFWVGGIAELPGPPIEVVGVVRNAKYVSLREEIHPTVFFPDTQLHDIVPANVFELRTAVRPTTPISSVRAAIASVNPAITLEFHTLAQQVSDSMVQERLLAQLSGFFGSLALLLVSIGLYGTVSYLVAQRQRELGIRLALGAEPGSILWVIMRDVFSILALGLLAGVAMSLALTRLLQQLLFGIGPRDTVTLVVAVAALSIVALVAGYLPGRRAMKVDPMVALRYE